MASHLRRLDCRVTLLTHVRLVGWSKLAREEVYPFSLAASVDDVLNRATAGLLEYLRLLVASHPFVEPPMARWPVFGLGLENGNDVSKMLVKEKL
jgi:hypothetical protein